MNARRLILAAALSLAALAAPARAAGTLPIALQQQFSFSGCSATSGVCGQPLNGGLLYFFQVGTVATRQDSFTDTSLSVANPWPLQLDANGRVPPFYLADGSVHVRLTDSAGLVQFDYASFLVIGPSGGGGGGATVDPTTIASTGDTKFRPTGESLTGWVKLNGLTIGSAISGATGRANADTQSLYTYLWTNCNDAHCPVLGGRGASGLADFNANKQLTLPDWRARVLVGLDDMGAAAAGRFAGVPFAGADTGITAGGYGGENTHTLTITEMPSHDHGGVNGSFLGNNVAPATGGNTRIQLSGAAGGDLFTNFSTVQATGIIAAQGGGGAHNDMQQFTLGTWHMKL